MKDYLKYDDDDVKNCLIKKSHREIVYSYVIGVK